MDNNTFESDDASRSTEPVVHRTRDDIDGRWFDGWDAVQEGRRSVRRKRIRSDSEHAGHDPLRRRICGADESGNATVQFDEIPRGDRAMPRIDADVGLGPRDDAVLSTGELIESREFHAPCQWVVNDLDGKSGCSLELPGRLRRGFRNDLDPEAYADR
jgi:hypothetical protein